MHFTFNPSVLTRSANRYPRKKKTVPWQGKERGLKLMFEGKRFEVILPDGQTHRMWQR